MKFTGPHIRKGLAVRVAIDDKNDLHHLSFLELPVSRSFPQNPCYISHGQDPWSAPKSLDFSELKLPGPLEQHCQS